MQKARKIDPFDKVGLGEQLKASVASEFAGGVGKELFKQAKDVGEFIDRKSTRLNSSHTVISYAVFCLKKKNKNKNKNKNKIKIKYHNIRTI